MKTLKALKVTSILNILLCFFCIASTVCFAIDYYYDLGIFHNIAYAFVYGMAIYPINIISHIVCSVIYTKEKKSPEAAQIIGSTHIWLTVWPVITIAFLMFAIMALAWFVGGV